MGIRVCRPVVRFAILFFLLLWSPASARAESEFLAARNLDPLRWIFLNPLPDSPNTVEHRQWRGAIDLAYATVFYGEEGGNGSSSVDMESAAAFVQVQYGVLDTLELGVEVPYRWMGGGAFDPFMIEYHSALGLPQGDRPDAPRNRFVYEITVDDKTYSPCPEVAGGVGDVVLSAKWQWLRNPEFGAAMRGNVKLPTGDGAAGFGSDHTDASLGWLFAWRKPSWSIATALDLIHFGGTPDPALPLGDPWGGSAVVSAGLTFWQSLRGICQLHYVTSPYDTGLNRLDSDTVMLSMGLKGGERSFVWTLGFTEDLAVETSPDFSVFLSLQWYLRRI